MHKRKIRVLIIEDSKVYQAYIKKILNDDEQIEVCGIAETGQEAIRQIEQSQPDVITLDLELPDVLGIELLEKVVKKCSIPIIVVTSREDLCQRAVNIGAKDYVCKIPDNSPRVVEQFALRLKLKVKMQATSFSGSRPIPLSKKEPDKAENAKGLILIGASLGGTETTLEILKELPMDMPGIVIVQHMTENFTESYAERLNRHCKMQVREAKDRDLIEAGTVLIAKGGKQLELFRVSGGYGIHLKENDGSQIFCPSVDVMFGSAAKLVGKEATAVILTGMGHDGAKGMKLLHDSGVYTIAESKETCVVYGMPRAAFEAGGVDSVLPKQKIASALIKRYEKA